MSAAAAEAHNGLWFPTPQELILRPSRTADAYDPVGAYEVDDAPHVIALGDRPADGFRVEIHIADAGLLYGTAHVDTARANGWSIYHEDGTVDAMLPQDVVKNMLSLDAANDIGVPAITIAFEHKPRVGIGAIEVFPSRVACTALTYKELRQRYRSGHKDAAALVNAARSLVKPEAHASFSGVRFGEKVIAQYMIKANLIMATRMAEKGIPWLFRNHTDEAYQTWQNIAERDKLEQLKAALYGRVALLHTGLAVMPYCHFTSPLRRFADLANHLTLHADIYGKPARYTEADLDEISRELTALYIVRSGHFKDIIAA